MNVLITGGFWAIAKFMVLLCGTVILIIKSIYVYQKKYQKWTVFTRILYVMTMGGFEIGIVIVMGGVTGIFTKNWDIVVMMLMIFSGIIGGMLMKVLVINEALLYSKEELEKYKFSQKCLWGSSIVLLIIAAIIYL